MNNRAEQLLLRHLSPEQKQHWRKHAGFFVTAPSGNKYWVGGIEGGSRTILYEEPNHQPRKRFCFLTYDDQGNQLPGADHVLAQKLLLEANEEHFLRIAHATSIARPLPPFGDSPSVFCALVIKRILTGLANLLLIVATIAIASAGVVALLYGIGRIDAYLFPQSFFIYPYKSWLDSIPDYVIPGAMTIIVAFITGMILTGLGIAVWSLGGSDEPQQ